MRADLRSLTDLCLRIAQPHAAKLTAAASRYDLVTLSRMTAALIGRPKIGSQPARDPFRISPPMLIASKGTVRELASRCRASPTARPRRVNAYTSVHIVDIREQIRRLLSISR